MSAIVTILRAAHCRSTHHFFAIDALSQLRTERGKRLGKLLLAEHHEYLLGAKAPDETFRDFQNHVLHVSDNYWGGATKKCEEWLAKIFRYSDSLQWNNVAYACGVLSHYFTDPLMPLHTGQSEKEAAVHRPMEWSVCKSYDAIAALLPDNLTSTLRLPAATPWIGGAVIEAATQAHTHYDRLIDIYDLKAGVRKPQEGLDEEARHILAELFELAISGWACILDRVANEMTVELPKRSLSIPTVLAAIDIPMAWVVKKVHDVNERTAVQKILKEFESTGKVVKNQPIECKVVAQQVQKARRATKKRLARAEETQRPASNLNSPHSSAPRAQGPGSSTHTSVTLASPIVDAPSIGPKTATRFHNIGITSIGEFLSEDTTDLVRKLGTRWINAKLIDDWKAQAKLVCSVPALCGYKAQLLVEIGCRDAKALSALEAVVLFADMKSLIQTKTGKRILRSSPEPTLEDVRSWQASAQSASHKEAA